MAGIGFELRKILRHDSYFDLLQGYAYAGVIASGPWILSIVGVLLMGVLSFTMTSNHLPVIQFQVSVTYLIAFSLILTGFGQLIFTRFMADILFARHQTLIIGVLMTMLTLTTLVATLFASIVGILFFKNVHESYLILMETGFVELCNIWILTIMASSIKNYKGLLISYFIAYASVIGTGILLRHYGLDGYLLAFDIGQSLLLLSLGALVILQYPGPADLSPTLFRHRKLFWSLVPIGFVFNLGIWADKIMFWFYPDTSGPIIGPLRASPVYDVPIFLSYLLIVPGLAVFLMRLETDFVEAYDNFYGAIRDGAVYAEITLAKQAMIEAARRGFLDIAKVQGVVVLLGIAFSAQILTTLGYSQDYVRIFEFDIIGTSLQLLLMSILNVYFYLDRRGRIFFLVSAFLIGNVILTGLTLWIGPFLYGAGFMFSLLITDMIGLGLLDRDFAEIEYETFMKNDYS
ncbi:exopolysaccharide Pel transporter PelG [Acidithiobacillus ferrianus]|uniref:Histidine kinase n=2 Tax=Acidithiobacillus ferrianus TaxID=2678518 RepID=A0A845U0K7_9PROT|nr:exopolysaccharide Pel transporter PelG [Acidithiobacillus ferrianus]NDU41082.1 hypothetical protein [Acidithiobacillus ferrianus]